MAKTVTCISEKAQQNIKDNPYEFENERILQKRLKILRNENDN